VSTPTPAPTPDPPLADAAGLELSVVEPALRPIEWVHAVGRLKTPRRESGEGILAVNAVRWGTVVVNGFQLGETPLEVRVRAGRHRVRVDRNRQRGPEVVVTVEAGQRTKLLR
jgi:hypothetical protein